MKDTVNQAGNGLEAAAGVMLARRAPPRFAFPRDHEVNMLTKYGDPPGDLNLRLSWWLIGLGMALGAALGLWSFGGPLPPPLGFEDPAALPRRLARLAHIALLALPVLNLLYVPCLRQSRWSARGRRLGCRLLLAGTLAMPAGLALAILWPPALALAWAAAAFLMAAVFILAAGLRQSPGKQP
jgi:hypothetical protein